MSARDPIQELEFTCLYAHVVGAMHRFLAYLLRRCICMHGSPYVGRLSVCMRPLLLYKFPFSENCSRFVKICPCRRGLGYKPSSFCIYPAPSCIQSRYGGLRSHFFITQ